MVIKSRVGDIFAKKYKNEKFVTEGYSALRQREYLYINFKNRYSLTFCLGPDTDGILKPSKMYTDETVFVIHEKTPECNLSENTSPETNQGDLNESLLTELNSLYPKHNRKIYFIIKNLTINNLLNGAQISLKYKKQSAKLHLYDFFSILFNPTTLTAKKLSKKERLFFKLLFYVHQTTHGLYTFFQNIYRSLIDDSMICENECDFYIPLYRVIHH